MKNRITAIIALLFLAFTGCATSQYQARACSNPSNLPNFSQDAYECRYRAKTMEYQWNQQFAQSGDPGIAGGLAEGMVSGLGGTSTYNKEYAMCMNSKGYSC